MSRQSLHSLTGFLPGSNVFEKARSAEKCRRSLWEFTRQAWHVFDPAPFKDNWHIGCISEHLEAATNKQITRLIINIPPGCLKSTSVSVAWPAWEWIDHPGEQSLFGSYDENLALRDSGKCRLLVDSEWYQSHFQPAWKFRKDQNAKGFYTNTLGGNRYTFGTKSGGKTGWRGNKVVLDDPNSVSDRYNNQVLADTYENFNQVIRNRVNDIETSALIIVQQRSSNRDMSGYLLSDSRWVHLSLPMEATSRPCTTVIGWIDPRKEGELLHPAKFPPKALEELKEALGREGWQSQYMQDPVPEGGARFNSAHFVHWYDHGNNALALHRRGGVRELFRYNSLTIFVTVDLAASEEQQADYTVFSTWGVTPRGDLLLLDMRRGRWTEGKIVDNAMEVYENRRYGVSPPACFIVEQNGLGLPIAQAMTARGLPVMYVHIHRTDKFSRTASAQVRVENGQVFFPDPRTPWYCEANVGWEQEMIMFPSHEHDDMVDTLALASEGVYEVNIFHLSEYQKVVNEQKTAAQAMQPRDDRTTGQKFFTSGRRA